MASGVATGTAVVPVQAGITAAGGALAHHAAVVAGGVVAVHHAVLLSPALIVAATTVGVIGCGELIPTAGMALGGVAAYHGIKTWHAIQGVEEDATKDANKYYETWR